MANSNIQLGENTVDTLYLGANQIEAIFLGENQIFMGEVNNTSEETTA